MSSCVRLFTSSKLETSEDFLDLVKPTDFWRSFETRVLLISLVVGRIATTELTETASGMIDASGVEDLICD